ncbi:MAG TPA: molecular chaperone HtpG [Planctomycetota bacterium]|nr:molecular chaperone HtpG [Planctomycetota bacterium]
MSTTTETHPFQAEVKELLSLMIHSLYSHREIFLRELISNASDAIDKLRFEALTNSALGSSQGEPRIVLEADGVAHILRVKDNGIGMSREEVIANLGTIARSGTRKFLEAAREKQASGLPQLIGQFGVGFYASFMVADEIVVVTRRAGESGGTRWRSKGDGEYAIEDAPDAAVGTTIELFLKARGADEDDEAFQDFADPHVLRELVRRYSDFVEYPIVMAASAFGKGHGLKEDTLEDGTKVAQLNTRRPLWARPKDEVTKEEHAEFYRHLTHDWHAPLEAIHFKVEGTSEYTALLYLPSERPPGWFEGRNDKPQVSLYVRRVFIMAECEVLLPPWLRFVRGVVDSQDLPLNVSREILQSNRQIGQIKKRLTKKVLDTFANLLQSRREEYEAFWRQFGTTIKEGIVFDGDNRTAVAAIALYPSSAGESLTTLDEYIARMPADAKDIFYLSATDAAAAARSPHLETLKARGREVLFFVDPVDDWVLEHLREYEGKTLVSVGRGEASWESDTARKEREEREREARSWLESLESALSDDVSRVRFSSRLTDSPAVLVDEKEALGIHMQRVFQQTHGSLPPQKRVLELNPSHPLIQDLERAHREAPDAERMKAAADLLLGQAQLAEGGNLKDPVRFSRLISDLMLASSRSARPPTT